MLVTFDSELRPLPVSVRVGNAVDVVGQAGKPKTITGFQVRRHVIVLVSLLQALLLALLKERLL